MGFSLFNKKPFDLLTDAEKERIVKAIRLAEIRTSGEIRVYMENRCPYIDPVERAAEVFFQLAMDKTTDRNAVLLYIAVKDHLLAIYADEGIYKKTGKKYWEEAVNHILQHFDKENFAAGVSTYVNEIGEALQFHFPYDRVTDQNELPDEIVFGDCIKK